MKLAADSIFGGNNMAYEYHELSKDSMRTRMDGETVRKIVAVDVEIDLTANDIFNWINNCQDPLTLRNLGNAALSFAAALERPDVDDFRSRA